MQIGFRTRLMLGVTMLLVTFVGTAVATLAYLTDRYADAQVEHERQALQASFALQMELLTDSIGRETGALARTPVLLATAAIPGVDAATLDDALSEVLSPVVAVLDPVGRVLASRGAWPAGTALGDAPGFETAVRGRIGTHVWQLRDELVVVAVAPLVQGDELLGVLVRGRPVDDALAARIGSLADREVVLLHDGRTLGAHPVDAQVERELAPLQRLRHATLAPTGASLRLQQGGLEQRGLALRLHEDAGIAYLSHDLAAIDALREQARMWLLVIAGLLLVGGLVFAVRTAARLSRPLHALTAASDRMRDGDLTTRVAAMPMDRELGRLARSFNAMAGTVQQLVADVREKAARAEAANRAKDGFLTSISHELRTPLTGILSTAELLQEFGAEASEAERRDFLATILQQAERLGQRIGDALDYAALAGGVAAWTVGRVDLQQVCEQACRRLAGLRELKAVEVQITCPPDSVLQGDREHITQAVQHLVHNAWTWSPGDAAVELRVQEVSGGYVVEVLDRGPGIAVAERERIFESFAQGGDVLVDKPAGIGIGLKIANEVASMHGGGIEYQDRPGGGACFRLLLRREQRPIDRGAVAAAAAAD